MDYTLLSCIDSRVESPMKFYGRFELGPFAPGQGLTVANSLRRSLLSQLTGTAIPMVEIYGASHEYETLVGVRESVLDILLNFKQIILTSDFEFFTAQVGFLNVKGPGVVRACDLKLPDFVYLVDGDQYIATLTTNGSLNIKFVIACGKNHLSHSPGTMQSNQWVTLLKKTLPLSPLQKQPFQQANFDALSTALNPGVASDFAETKEKKEKITEKEKQLVLNKQTPSSMAFYQQWKKQRSLDPSLSQPYKNWNKKIRTQHSDGNIDFIESSPQSQAGASSNAEAPIISLPKDRNEKIGYFPIDATFMPVTRVNYLIQSNDDLQLAKDRILLEVWTNGSIHPRHAIHKAAKALIQLFLPLQQMNHIGKQTLTKQNQSTNPAETESFDSFIKLPFETNENFTKATDSKQVNAVNTKTKDLKQNPLNSKQAQPLRIKQKLDPRLLKLDIGNLDLASRPYSSLKMANIQTIEDLLLYSKSQLLKIPNLSQSGVNQIEAALLDFNLTLKT